MPFDAMTQHYEEITVCGKPALFTSFRIKRIPSRIICMPMMSGTMMNVVVFHARLHPLSWSTIGEQSSLQHLWNCLTMGSATSTKKKTGIILRWMPTIHPALPCIIFKSVTVSK